MLTNEIRPKCHVILFVMLWFFFLHFLHLIYSYSKPVEWLGLFVKSKPWNWQWRKHDVNSSMTWYSKFNRMTPYGYSMLWCVGDHFIALRMFIIVCAWFAFSISIPKTDSITFPGLMKLCTFCTSATIKHRQNIKL